MVELEVLNCRIMRLGLRLGLGLGRCTYNRICISVPGTSNRILISGGAACTDNSNYQTFHHLTYLGVYIRTLIAVIFF